MSESFNTPETMIPTPYNGLRSDGHSAATISQDDADKKRKYISCDTSALFGSDRKSISDKLAQSLFTHLANTLFRNNPRLVVSHFDNDDLSKARNEWFASLQVEDGEVVASGMPTDQVVHVPEQSHITSLGFDTGYGGHTIHDWKLSTKNPTTHRIEVDRSKDAELALPNDCLKIYHDSAQGKNIIAFKPAISIRDSDGPTRACPTELRDDLVSACLTAVSDTVKNHESFDRDGLLHAYKVGPMLTAVQTAVQRLLSGTNLTRCQLRESAESGSEDWVDFGDFGQNPEITDVKEHSRGYMRWSKQHMKDHIPFLHSGGTRVNNAEKVVNHFLSSMPDEPPTGVSYVEYSQALHSVAEVLAWSGYKFECVNWNDKFASEVDAKIVRFKDAKSARETHQLSRRYPGQSQQYMYETEDAVDKVPHIELRATLTADRQILPTSQPLRTEVEMLIPIGTGQDALCLGDLQTCDNHLFTTIGKTWRGKRH